MSRLLKPDNKYQELKQYLKDEQIWRVLSHDNKNDIIRAVLALKEWAPELLFVPPFVFEQIINHPNLTKFRRHLKLENEPNIKTYNEYLENLILREYHGHSSYGYALYILENTAPNSVISLDLISFTIKNNKFRKAFSVLEIENLIKSLMPELLNFKENFQCERVKTININEMPEEWKESMRTIIDWCRDNATDPDLKFYGEAVSSLMLYPCSETLINPGRARAASFASTQEMQKNESSDLLRRIESCHF
jgi:hypothetical protein